MAAASCLMGVCICCVVLPQIGQYLMTVNGCVFDLCGVAADWSVPDDSEWLCI